MRLQSNQREEYNCIKFVVKKSRKLVEINVFFDFRYERVLKN